MWGELLGFPGNIPCIHEVYMLLNFWGGVPPINLSSYYRDVITKHLRRVEEELRFLASPTRGGNLHHAV